MIREETLTTFDKWVPPTHDEICELIEKSGLRAEELAKILGVNKATIYNWRSGGVEGKKSTKKLNYSNWAWLCFIVGERYINEPCDDIRDLNRIISRFTKMLQIYNEKLTRELSVVNSKNKRISKNLLKIAAIGIANGGEK